MSLFSRNSDAFAFEMVQLTPKDRQPRPLYKQTEFLTDDEQFLSILMVSRVYLLDTTRNQRAGDRQQ